MDTPSTDTLSATSPATPVIEPRSLVRRSLSMVVSAIIVYFAASILLVPVIYLAHGSTGAYPDGIRGWIWGVITVLLAAALAGLLATGIGDRARLPLTTRANGRAVAVAFLIGDLVTWAMLMVAGFLPWSESAGGVAEAVVAVIGLAVFGPIVLYLLGLPMRIFGREVSRGRGPVADALASRA